MNRGLQLLIAVTCVAVLASIGFVYWQWSERQAVERERACVEKEQRDGIVRLTTDQLYSRLKRRCFREKATAEWECEDYRRRQKELTAGAADHYLFDSPAYLKHMVRTSCQKPGV